MRFLLDTNICIYIIKQKPLKVIHKFQSINSLEVTISSITIAELEYRVFKSQRQAQHQSALRKLIEPLIIIPFAVNATQTYGAIRAELERQGVVIRAMDLLIVAQAITSNLILITNNMRKFSRIPNLSLENWVE